MVLKHKTILIISPQPWGTMHISKHHYAIALAKLGNQVFFLNPPELKAKEQFSIELNTEIDNLYIITYRPFFSLDIRFNSRRIFDILMRFQISKMLRYLDKPIDIVWCFEPTLYSNLNWFKATINIYHPVDHLIRAHQIEVGRSAHLILTVTQEILNTFNHLDTPKALISHGLADVFAEAKPIIKDYAQEDSLRVGYAGNLLNQDIDIPILVSIIQENPGIEFHFWGIYRDNHPNWGGKVDTHRQAFIDFLISASNVYLHGPVSPAMLAISLQAMDAFLICYYTHKGQCRGTNAHKIMEYLSTGKVIISNHFTTFKDRPDLIQMHSSRLHNEGLPKLFKKVIDDIEIHNNPSAQHVRAAFARAHTYGTHILQIDTCIHAVVAKRTQ